MGKTERRSPTMTGREAGTGAMMSEDRLNRIENTLEKITDILATQAAHDERITALAAREQRSEERLDAVEVKVQHNSFVNSVLQWFSGAVVSGLIVYAIKTYL